VPWGISEAAYNARDREMTYQYTNFGVPGLGLKRGLAQNLVIAPYATVLAAQFRPHEAVRNLAALTEAGALGRYGFYDAVDYTPQRVPVGSTHAVVFNYMAHHQGMSIVAVANAIFEGRMRDRFHSDPVIEAAELLLQEKAPRDIPVATTRTEVDESGAAEEVQPSDDNRIILDPATALRATNLMSNGRYCVMVTATGTGYSRWNDIAVTRWRADPSEDRDGTFLFLRDLESGEWWSATAALRRAPGEHAVTHFSDDKATFTKAVGTLRSELECIVVSEGQGEGRRITLHNDGDTDRHIEVTSYAEFVLAPEASDTAHPAFSKMFVETEIGPAGNVVFARRRKRSASDPDLAAAHFVTDDSRDTEAETDRRAFIGRGRTLAQAAAFDPGARLGGRSGFVMDPVAALRRRIRVPANKKVQVTFWTVVGNSREEVDASVALLSHPDSFNRQAMMSWTRSQVQTRHLGLSLADASNVQRLARYLIYPDAALRTPAETIASGLGRQSALWPMAISGDFPIFAVRIGDVADLEIVGQALRFQEYLRARGMRVDLAIVNEQAASYVQDLQQAIEALCENSRLRGHELGPRQHIFAVRRDLMDESSYRTLLAAAWIVLHTRNGTIFDQIERAEGREVLAREAARAAAAAAGTGPAGGTGGAGTAAAGARDLAADGTGLAAWNGFGGFADGGRDYVVRLIGTRSTPQPWINVIANAGFGFHTSAEGASFTWSRNSRDFQLTPWSNDPVVNRPGEAIYVYDHAGRRGFSPFAAVMRDPAILYEARHGQGVSTFTARRGAIAAELTQLVDPADPVKVSRLTLRNTGTAPAKLTVYAYAEWVLGNSRARSAPNIVPSLEAETGALFAANPYSLDFADRVAFLAGDRPADSVTTDRGEFLGADGSVEWPAAVAQGARLSGRVEAGLDPCAALARVIEIAPGAEASMLWLMGDAGSAEEAKRLVEQHRAGDFDARLADNAQHWNDFLGAVQVETPDAELDLMVNRWLPYQGLSCRILARSAFYQASGAFGFRDQLQDTLALLLHDPSLARAQILNAAGRQFLEGDVQHWWLPRTGAGVRTMISDDIVWLAHAAAHYAEATGDAAILDETVPYISGPPLQPGEHDAFFQPEPAREAASLYDHCVKALDLALARRSPGGLPLMLGGDWNDGMNRVGEGGRGESVWLGWFLLKTLRDFAGISGQRGDTARAERWRDEAAALAQALERSAWDGAWYRRGSYDDGSPLGSRASDECRIDSIAQSWSVLAGADVERSRQAMQSALSRLVDPDLQIIKLFEPPFEDTLKDPGYIRSYPPGVRENGGQYTHAATWFVIALAKMGRADDAWRCFRMLNPVSHTNDEAAVERYRVEPYAVAADVYSVGDKAGRGGWTWYTGSAGWLLRAAVEGLLGITRRAGRIRIDPAIPTAWPGFAARLRIEGETYHIRVSRRTGGEGLSIEVNGMPLVGNEFALGAGREEARRQSRAAAQ
jgi:cyclic beta-1,2-glucan synthetase